MNMNATCGKCQYFSGTACRLNPPVLVPSFHYDHVAGTEIASSTLYPKVKSNTLGCAQRVEKKPMPYC